MAYRKVIEVNPLSKKSINNAIRELRDYKKELESSLIDKFMDGVAARVSNIILSRFLDASGRGWNSNASIPQVRREGHNRVISVNGSQVAFLEFGAGAEAGEGMYPYTKSPDSDAFTPGSWSKDNGRTYQAWENGGYVGLYPYEQPPARGFDTAISELPYIIKEVADEVFG